MGSGRFEYCPSRSRKHFATVGCFIVGRSVGYVGRGDYLVDVQSNSTEDTI